MKKVQCDARLLFTLKNGRAEDIDGLVNIITDYGKGRAFLDAEIKNHLVLVKNKPSADRYDEATLSVLARELQGFGGHSAINLMRNLLDRPLVPYEEIVTDVHKKLNGKDSKNKSIHQKHKEIALALFGEDWEQLPFKERHERCISTTVLTGLFNMEKALLVSVAAGMLGGLPAAASAALFLAPKAAVGVGGRLFALPATTALGVQSTLAEAYRITIPFVAQVGWMQLKQERLASDKAAQPAAAARSSLALESKGALNTEVKTEEGQTLFAVREFTGSVPKHSESLGKEGISHLNSLLSVVPSVASFAELQRGEYVLCSIPFDALVSSTKVEGAARAFVHDGQGIAAHANLMKPEALQSVMVSGMVWAAISAAVAQKHLQDISQKLDAIVQQLDLLKRDLEEQNHEKLEALRTYVQSCLDHLPTDQLMGWQLNALEMSLRDVYFFELYFQRKAEEEIEHIKDIKSDSYFGNGDSRQQIIASLDSMGRWVQGYLKSKQLLLVICSLLSQGSGQTKQRYKEEAKRSIREIKSIARTYQEAVPYYKAKMELSSSMVSEVSDELVQNLNYGLSSINQSIVYAEQDIKKLYDFLFEKKEHQILIKIQNGQVVTGELLLG